MNVKFTLTKVQLARLREDTPDNAAHAIAALAFEGQAYVVNSFGKDGSPSTPGGAPGIDTGNLKNSITTADGRDRFHKRIEVGADYGLYLEFGTTRMAARPFMTPMAIWLEKQIDRVFDEFLLGGFDF